MYQDLAKALRFLSIDAVEKAKSGHPGMPLGMADVATVLFHKHIKFLATKPKWFNRDRFVLSCGHGSMLLYSLLYCLGYQDITIDDIKNFRQLHSPCAGHPEYEALAGIETTTGPLGQGLANAVGMAIAESYLHTKNQNISHYTFVFASDGDMMEGISHEALSLAGHLRLNKLIIFYDSNNVTIDGPLSLSCNDDAKKRFESYGFYVQEIDGHDYDQIDQAITKAKISALPSIIICHTKIGFGAFEKEGMADSHGSPLGEAIIARMRISMNWPYPPFEIPEDILKTWRLKGIEHQELFDADPIKDAPHLSYDFAISEVFRNVELKDMATRQASEVVLNYLTNIFDTLIGGSADLTPSNNTKTKHMNDMNLQNKLGNYIHFGIREHAMAAAMSGMVLHGGIRAYGGSFLTFTDYMRPAIRLSAYMKQPVIYVMTHDSIGLGEDGPTHQPIEHLSALRAIPNLYLYRPCDMVETAECWQLALKRNDNPSVLALSRQKLKQLRTLSDDNKSQHGAYLLGEKKPHDFVVLASGSEVGLAHDVCEALSKAGHGYKLISVPCLDYFMEDNKEYRDQLLEGNRRIVIEAGIRMSWDCILRPCDLFFGAEHYGYSAPYEDVYKAFDLTVDKIVKKILEAK